MHHAKQVNDAICAPRITGMQMIDY